MICILKKKLHILVIKNIYIFWDDFYVLCSLFSFLFIFNIFYNHHIKKPPNATLRCTQKCSDRWQSTNWFAWATKEKNYNLIEENAVQSEKKVREICRRSWSAPIYWTHLSFSTLKQKHTISRGFSLIIAARETTGGLLISHYGICRRHDMRHKLYGGGDVVSLA